MPTAKELFNQALVTELDDDIRFAAGIPSQEGCNNVKFSVLVGLLAKGLIRSSGAIEVIAGDNIINFSSSFETTDYSLTIYDIEGIGVQITAQAESNFTINCLSAGFINYIAIKNI